jgi:hypothetical protein
MGNLPPQRLSERNNQLDISGVYHMLNVIGTNAYMLPGDFIESQNKTYRLELTNGNLQLVNKNGDIKWQTNTTNGNKFMVQTNCDCILYDTNNNSIWKLSEYAPYWYTNIKPKLIEEYNKNSSSTMSDNFKKINNLEYTLTSLVLNDSGLIIISTGMIGGHGKDIIATIPNNDVYFKCPECQKCPECKSSACPACEVCPQDNSKIFYGIIGGMGCLILILIFIIIFIVNKK